MPSAAARWTADMVRALPDDRRHRYEVIDGELFVTPAPSGAHQRAVGDLFIRLSTYLRGQSWGEVVFSPADISFHADMLVQPDLFVVPIGNKPRWRNWTDIRALLLTVEVLSPSTARADRQAKRRLYQREGVEEYWIVDVDARIVERWRPADERPEIVSANLTWQPAHASTPFELDLRAFFDEVLRD
jgi:Uma2 family endonuclease